MAHTFPPTPELERITYYPNYPVGPRGKEITSDIDANGLNFCKICTSIWILKNMDHYKWYLSWRLRYYKSITLLTFTTPPRALHSRSLVQHRSLWSEQRKLHIKCHAFHFITDIWKYFLKTLYLVLLLERDTVLIERSNLVNISKLVVKEVNIEGRNDSRWPSFPLTGDWEQSQVWSPAGLWSHSAAAFLHRARACSQTRSQTEKGGNIMII